MKATTSAAFLLLFLFVFSTKSCFLGVATAEPVLDIDGEEVRTGVEYYVFPTIRGAGGGGLDLGSPVNQWCPKFIIQQLKFWEYGSPVTFWPVDANASIVHLSTDLNVVFVPSIDAYCRQSTQWKLDNYDPSTGQWLLTTGADIRGEPGPKTLKNWFKIEKFVTDTSYKFRFCPSVCDSCVTLCSDVGRYYNQDDQMRLALSTQGWSFKLIKSSRVKKQVA